MRMRHHSRAPTAAVAWTLAAALLLLAPLPPALARLGGMPGGGFPLDKLAHVVLFWALTRAWIAASGRDATYGNRAARLALVAACYGGVLELLQPRIAGRSASWGDLAADAVGSGAALWISRRRAAPPL